MSFKYYYSIFHKLIKMGQNCFCKGDKINENANLKSEFKDIQLLIGLKENEKLKELNAILQCLGHIEILAQYFKYQFYKIKKIESYKNYHSNDKSLCDSFKDIIEKMYPDYLTKRKEHRGKPILKTEYSKDFLKKIYEIEPNYNINQELLDFILMRLHKELNMVNNSNTIYSELTQTDKISAFKNYFKNFEKEHKSKISDNFFWTIYTETFCLNCGNYFFDFQYCKFKFFSLDQVNMFKFQICQNNNVFFYTGINLYDCLIYEQQMKNSFQLCKKCGVEANCNIRNNIFVTPKILIFLFIRNISSQNIKFIVEENINMSQFVENKSNIIYNLFGIIYISFQNKYIAYCKSLIDNQWYSYEDEKVEIKNNFQEIANQNEIPYILFYQVSKGRN